MDIFLVLMIAVVIHSGSGASVKCPEQTQPHSTECNKYLKCVELRSNIISWITMSCPEGLIYDKNLRSCAIPSDDWECLTESGENQQDENNVYGIDNLDVSQEQPESDSSGEYLEVIGENLSSAKGRESDSFDLASDDGSGDDGFPLTATQPAPTVRMLVTTQLQRLTQLMQSIQNKADGVVNDAEVTAHDLNSFLATQKIQSDSPDYQKIDFQSNDKRPIPSNGGIHPEIMSNILNRQITLNSELTTPSMDATTPRPRFPPIQPTYYVDKDPVTEIQLKSGLALDGTPGSHQIVVNRPEGSVLFNVPASEQNHHSPYLSEDILKTILEISKQMVTQNQKQNPQVSYAPQPFYYGVPIPMLPPQSNVQTFYNHDYRNNLTQVEKPVINTKTRPSNIQIISKPSTHQVMDEKSETADGYYNPLGYYQPAKAQNSYTPQSSVKDYLQPYYYYRNYPNYQNGYQSVQQQQAAYQQAPQSYNNYQYGLKKRFDNPLHYNQPQYNFDIPHFGNRPLVSDSSAPFYVEHPSLQPKPYVKESYLSSLYDDSEDEDAIYDEIETIESTEKPVNELICSINVQRQANKTDCMRYYVCNAKTKEVLSYTCPMFTAFNDQTKYCDSQLFSSCKKSKDREISLSQNKRIFAETNKALEAVKKESQKVERIASMVRKESQKFYTRRNQFGSDESTYATRYENDQYPSRYNQDQRYEEIPQTPFHPARTEPPKLKTKQPLRRPQLSTTTAPFIKEYQKPKQSSKRKKKKVKCAETGNIVDPESSVSYWHCFKGTDGRMKRINRKCTSSFVFCPKSRYCTPATSC